MPFPFAIIGAGISIGSSLFAAGRARDAAAKAEGQRIQAENTLKELELSRQKIINPFRNVENLSDMAQDLSDMISNPFANLGVATSAAEIQMEQSDLALANTLDTLRSTGSSAGGATALAQAALQSKKGVSASIEQQEAQNEKLAAQGEQQMERLRMGEAARIQGIEISEGQRIQMAEAQGEQFMFGAREGREMQKMNRVAGLADRYAQQQMQAGINETAAYTGAISALGSLGAAAMGSQASKYAADLEFGIDDAADAIATSSSTSMGTYTGYGRSDRKLKQNIKLIGVSSKGLNIYAFEYINKAFGTGTWQGVMSDEIPQNAVAKHKDGYDMVDYSMLDVTFKQI